MTVASGVTVPSAVTVIGTSPMRRLGDADGDRSGADRDAPDCRLPPTHLVSRIATPTAIAITTTMPISVRPERHENHERHARARARARRRAGGGLDGLAHPVSELGLIAGEVLCCGIGRDNEPHASI